jgi:hypothetical protein
MRLLKRETDIPRNMRPLPYGISGESGTIHFIGHREKAYIVILPYSSLPDFTSPYFTYGAARLKKVGCKPVGFNSRYQVDEKAAIAVSRKRAALLPENGASRY